MYKYLIAIIFFFCSAFAQNVYQVPFASKDNTIELELVNSTKKSTGAISVKAVNIPGWIKMENQPHSLTEILANDVSSVSYTFDVDISAPVNREEIIVFEISDGVEKWTKEIVLSVQVPKKLELMNNYPNPFNPVTTIGFTLPDKGEIVLDIFNMLGQKVERLVNSKKDAGYFSVEWNASNFASGIYIYRLSFTDSKGNQKVIQNKLTLLK